MNPDYACPTVNIFGCGNTIGSLLSACRQSDERTFNFGAEKIGDTVFLDRQTPPGELIEGVRGYGHTFPEAYTTWPRDVKGSASHQRLVEYMFGAFRVLIRSESDGYLPEKCDLRGSTDNTKAQTFTQLSLEEATDTLAVSRPVEIASSNLVVQSAGQAIPQKAIFDLKTRWKGKEVDMEEFLPRLWVNQTPNFIIARHHNGIFTDVKTRNVKDDVQQWEADNKDVLLCLHSVFSKLIELTGRDGCSRVQVRRVGTGPLEIREPTKEWSVLPADLKAKWEGKEASEAKGKDGSSDDSDSDSGNEDYLKF